MDLADAETGPGGVALACAPSRGPFEIGQIVANTYLIEGVLGAGGMGVVYEASDLNLPRRVAIKAPRFPAFAQALRTEAQALAAIRHPAFVAVHHFGRHESVDFFAMERIFGDTLEGRLDELRRRHQRLTIEEALDVLIAIADGLSAAHRVGVAHRDLKASNVILSGERTVLIDLGLFIPEVLVGPDNVAAGSVHAMAPEVLLGTVTQGNGPFIDLYALGALAFELLTGLPPYTGVTNENVLSKHMLADVPDPRDHREEIPAPLAWLVRELLAKEPYDRPSSAEAVLWQLKELRGHGALRARRTTVLVVDDDASTGLGVKGNLEQSFPQLEVRTTTDPSDALPRHGRAPADVIVVDINMPGINGIEVCMALRSLPAAMRPAIIAMSGSAGPRDVSLLRELGVVRFVPKDEALFRAVGDVVGSLRCEHRAPTPPLLRGV